MKKVKPVEKKPDDVPNELGVFQLKFDQGSITIESRPWY